MKGSRKARDGTTRSESVASVAIVAEERSWEEFFNIITIKYRFLEKQSLLDDLIWLYQLQENVMRVSVNFEIRTPIFVSPS